MTGTEEEAGARERKKIDNVKNDERTTTTSKSFNERDALEM